MKKLLLILFTLCAVSASAQLTINAMVSNVNCHGDSTGAINIDITNGTPLYNFMWSNGTTDQVLLFIPAGIYGLTVSDANGETASQAITVIEPEALGGTVTHVNASSGSASDGSITITATGGTSPFNYSIDGGSSSFTTNAFSNVSVNCYTPFLRDANDCVTTLDTVCVSFSSFVSNIQAAVLTVYPNPAQNYIDVNTSLTVSTIEIYNSIGQLVIRKDIHKMMNRVDVTMLNSGSYFIRFNNDGNAIKYFSVTR